MKALKQSNEDTIAAINDLSENACHELDDFYLTLLHLANKQKQTRIGHRPIGLEAYGKEE